MPPKEEIERRIEKLSNNEPFDSKFKLYNEIGVPFSGYYSCYPNHLPRLIREMEDE
tara:strand:- start:8431 stop:8598 length:168 start_codon:yes stop_codon:yes gene_type:complete